MLIKAGLSHRLTDLISHLIILGYQIIFRSEKHLISTILTVLQSVLAVDLLMIVNLNDGNVISRIMLIIEKLGRNKRLTLQFPLCGGVVFFDLCAGNQLCVEEIPGLLNIRDLRLPVKIQQVYGGNANITQATQFVTVPDNLVHASSRLAFTPHRHRIHILELILLKDAGNDRTQGLCLLLICRLPGKEYTLWKCIHGICMFGGDYIVQPACLTCECATISDIGELAFFRKVAKLPPVL